MLIRKLKHSGLTNKDYIEFEIIPLPFVSILRQRTLLQIDFDPLNLIGDLTSSIPSPRISSQTTDRVHYARVPPLRLKQIINLYSILFWPARFFYYTISTFIQHNCRQKEFGFAFNRTRHTTII
jgi:hypothetical protein